MKLLMISGDRSLQHKRKGAFYGLLEEFRTHWDRIDILCPHDVLSDLSGTASSFCLMEKVWVHSGSASIFKQPHFLCKKGAELMREHGHDVMTVHEYPPFYNGLGAKSLSRKTGVPANLEIHHLVGYPRPANFQEGIARFLSRVYLGRHSRSFAAVRTVNREVLETLVRFGVDRKKITIVPSVYLDHTLYQNLSSIPKQYDLVFCGRLVTHKGLFPVLEAMRLVPTKTLLVIGDGPEFAAAEEYVLAHGMEHRVTFVGWLKDSKSVMEHIASGRVFIMNSASEGNPRVAVEAMASGLPILATRVGIMPDVVRDGENGMFTNGTARDIAEKIDQIFGNDSRMTSMGKNAMHVLSLFEKKVAIKNYADFLKRIPEKKNGAV